MNGIRSAIVNLFDFIFIRKSKDRKIKKAIKEFERKNDIEIKRYHSNPPGVKGIYKDPWIGNDVFRDRIVEWLKICDNKREEDIFLKLLSNYLYFPKEYYSDYIDKMLQDFTEEVGEEKIKQTIFLGVPRTDGVVCGAINVCSNISTHFLDGGVKEQIFVNFLADKEKVQNAINECEYIVIMDDMSGSGATLFSTVRTLCSEFAIDYSIKIYALFLCANIEKVKEKVKSIAKDKNIRRQIEYRVLFDVDKCVNPKNKSNKKYPILAPNEGRILKEIERKIAEADEIVYESDPVDNCIMGYANGQLLLSFFYNTPNNTISTFWRPTSNNLPLFTRSDRTRLKDCQSKKKSNNKKAYRYGCK